MSMTLGPIVPARTGSSEVLPVARSPSSNVFWVILAYASAEARARPMLRERYGGLHGPRMESRRDANRRRSARETVGALDVRGRACGAAVDPRRAQRHSINVRRRRSDSAPGRARSAPSGGRVLLAELVHAPRGVDDLLLAGVERMAVRADLDVQVVAQRRPRLERVAAAADHVDLFVLGVNRRFHG